MNGKYDEIINCICAWYDLLGYGKPFVESKWNMFDQKCIESIHRIKKLKSFFTSSWSVKPIGTKLSFNDGFAHVVDVDSSNIKDLAIFFDGLLNDFDSINYNDQKEGFPGVRGVVSCGQRFIYDNCNISEDLSNNRTVVYYPKEFQMNSAFSKAFIMEEAGSRAGLKGPGLYLDIQIFSMFKKLLSENNHPMPTIKGSPNGLMIEINSKDGFLLKFEVENNPVIFSKEQCQKYDNRGIETTLYKYVPNSCHSYIDEIASASAYAQMQRLSQMYNTLDEE